jgi:16S rRNA U516 pseudouridylate synthase RsuA-like enzyme
LTEIIALLGLQEEYSVKEIQAKPVIMVRMEDRLQKILAKAGYGSRRACEEFISAGRVRVNGQLAELGQKADPTVDHISLDGKPLPKLEKLVYIALHKPRYVLSTVEREDDDNRETVINLVAERVRERVYPVGRLDLESEGLILLTNTRCWWRAIPTRNNYLPGGAGWCWKMATKPLPRAST